MEEYQRIIEEVRSIVNPDMLVLYGTKRDIATGNVKDIDLSIVAEVSDKTTLEHDLYLAIASDVSFDIIVYTPAEWDTLTSDPQSFAHRILQKGTVVYER